MWLLHETHVVTKGARVAYVLRHAYGTDALALRDQWQSRRLHTTRWSSLA